MTTITVKVNGIERTAGNLSRLASMLRDRSTPNRAVAAQFYSWTLRNYDSDGSLVGGWAPLAPSTVAQKAKIGKEQMLVRTGTLRNSLIGNGGAFSDGERAGIGSAIPYSIYHEQGTARMPRRQIIPNEEQALEMATRVYEFYVAKATQDANQ